MNEKVYYKTSNINLASTLHTLNIPIDGIYTQENSDIYQFYFESTPELHQLVDKFWKRELRVEPHGLLVVRKEILDEIARRKQKVS